MSAWKASPLAGIRSPVARGGTGVVEPRAAADVPLAGEGLIRDASESAGGLTGLLLDLAQLAKLRVNLLVVVTVYVGFSLGSAGTLPYAGGGAEAIWRLVHTLVGTFLLGAGASALNQLFERDLDALMERTRRRPLPGGRLAPATARAAGVLLEVAGVLWLAVLVHPLAAALGALTSVVYVFLYTPLKRRTSLSLIVGAVAGALPPLIGWAAAGGRIGGAAWTLFTVQFIWQVPHFLAIAWLYRDDYRAAGYPMLPVVDTRGVLTALQTFIWSLALLPASLVLPVFFGLGGPAYFFVALVLGIVFLASAAAFALRRTRRTARFLVIVSIVYLPVLFLSLVGLVHAGQVGPRV